MRILVCGGRDYHDYDKVKETLDKIIDKETVIIQGGANGADALASRYANENKLSMLEYPANWVQYGKAAGPIRNKLMITAGKPDLVVAFPGGRGTANMVALAKAANIPVLTILQ